MASPDLSSRAATPDALPWETRDAATVARFLRSWRMLLSRPAAFYDRMALGGGLGEPLSFAAISVGAGAFATAVYLLVATLVAPSSGWVAWFPGAGTPAVWFNLACLLVFFPVVAKVGCATPAASYLYKPSVAILQASRDSPSVSSIQYRLIGSAAFR